MQPLGKEIKPCNLLGQKNHATTQDTKIMQSLRIKKKKITHPLETTKKSRNLFGQKKILQPIGPKKIPQSLCIKINCATSQDKEKSCILLGLTNLETSQDNKTMKPLGTKKNHATSWDKKIMHPLWTTKKSRNLLGQKNHATSWDKKNYEISLDKKNHATSWGNTKIKQPIGQKKTRNVL